MDAASGRDAGQEVGEEQQQQQQRTLRRLRRENHLLRQQILRMQEERRAAAAAVAEGVQQHPAAPSPLLPGVARKGGVGAEDLVGGDPDGTRRDALAREHSEATTSEVGGYGGDETEAALQLRLKTLQRQGERERLRRMQMERDLRAEVATLRHSADPTRDAAALLPAPQSSPPGHADATSTSSEGVWPAPRRHEEDDETDAIPLSLPSASLTQGVDGESRQGTPPPPHRRRGFSAASSVVSSDSNGGAAGLLLRHHEEDPSYRASRGEATARLGDGQKAATTTTATATATATAVPLSAASAEEVQRMYEASVERYTAASRGSGEGGRGTFIDFHSPLSPAAAGAEGASHELRPRLADDPLSHRPDRGNEADEVMRKAADRRAMRRQRLEKLAAASTVSSSSLANPHSCALSGEEDGGGDTPLGRQNAEGSRLEESSLPRGEDGGGSGSGSGNDNGNPNAGKDSHAATATATATTRPSPQTRAPTYNLANPNQIGVEIKEDERDRTWYLKQVIVQALLRAIHPQTHREDIPIATDPVVADDNPSCTPQPWMRALMDDDDDDDNDSVHHNNKKKTSDGEAKEGERANGSIGNASFGASSTTAAPAPAAQSANQFVYRDINMIAMQRAIAECVSMHFRCRRNEPFCTPNYREGAAPQPANTASATVAGGGGAGGRLGAFADENTDANLLEAFSPAHMNRRGAEANVGNGVAADWDDDDDDDGGGLGGAFGIDAANNRALSPQRRGGGVRHRKHSTSGNAKGETRERYREDEVLVQFHAPVIFSQIRSFLRLDDNYLRASIEKAVWRQSASPGKSKTTLYYFADFVMKSMKESEVDFFSKHFLPHYVQYCERYPHTLLPRFYAVVTVKWLRLNVKKVFLLMQNVFTTRYYIHRIYDVKGSTVGRSAYKQTTTKAADGTEQTVLTAPRTAFGALLLKDNDLPPQLVICGAYQRAILLAQFRSDVNFLSSLSIVDYSCMIGVRSRVFSAEQGPSKTIVLRRRTPAAHYGRTKAAAATAPNGTTTTTTDGKRNIKDKKRRGNRYGINSSSGVGGSSSDEGEDDGGGSFVTQNVADLANSGAIGIGASLATASTNYGYEFGSYGGAGKQIEEDDLFVCLHGCDGGLLSLPIYAPGDDTTAREDVYYLGIIDVLQEYNSVKKLENFAKGLVNDRRQISVIPPKDYAERLYKVLERIAI